MKVRELMEDIRKKDIVLPEFQREYVWRRDQARKLIISLFKEYPVGGLLFWKTDNPPELKRLPKLPDKLGTLEVILDGQQRLTTLYMLSIGEIPPFYTDRDIDEDVRNLYFNLDSADFQYYQPSTMKGNPLWHRVVDCLTSQSINVFEIAKGQAVTDGEVLKLAQKYNDNLNQLRKVLDLDLAVQIVPAKATIEEAIDIFDLVNSQGTKLTDAELALTHATGKWPQARQTAKAKIEELRAKHFDFDLTFITRALTVVVTRRALFPNLHHRSKDELIAGWEQLSKLLDYLVAFLPHRASIHCTQDINTTNVLIPLIAYLSVKGGKFWSDIAIKHALHWLYAAHIWARYTSQTDQRLEHDVSIVVQEPDPWSQLCEQIIDQRGRIEVKASDMEGRGIQHPLYRMAYTLAKAHGAMDWFNGVPLGAPHEGAYRVHSHHIFPQSLLYNNGYDQDNHLHRQIVNEIANRAFLTAEGHAPLLNKSPEEYLAEVEERYPGALVKQFIPMDPVLWKLGNFEKFLEARRELIARKMNEFMEALVAEPTVRRERRADEFIHLGESATLEFKSTLRWDTIQNKINKELQFSVLKTIAAFLNSAGGTLLIGVGDNETVYGIEQDLKTLGNGTPDIFQQTLVNLISEHLGAEFSPLVRIRFDKVEGCTVCIVDVDKAPRPAFTKTPKGTEFFVRLGNTTRSLDLEETHDYIQMNWES